MIDWDIRATILENQEETIYSKLNMLELFDILSLPFQFMKEMDLVVIGINGEI